MQRLLIPGYTWLLLALAAASSLNAGSPGTDSENRRLAGIDRELELIERLSFEAEAMANEDTRNRFNYPVLRRHLQLMRMAIQDHIRISARQPRELPPIEVTADAL